MLVASDGHTSMVKLLIENGADLELKDDIGCTALMHAAMEGRASVVKLLVEAGAEDPIGGFVGEEMKRLEGGTVGDTTVLDFDGKLLISCYNYQHYD